ncbi:MAG: hypothetical protein E7608_05985 [Ruminococcaceae bacterium]|nr:hypothetical protein [Oscillospiraceae bacterium]
MNTDTQGNDIMPYLKKRKKQKGNAKSFLVILIFCAIIMLAAVIYGSGRELFSFFAEGAKTDGSTATTESTQDARQTSDSPSIPEIPQGARKIIKTDMSAAAQGKLYENETDREVFASRHGLASLSADDIYVLIICSRGFETYLAEEAFYLDGDYPAGMGTASVCVCARSIAANLTLSGVGALYIDVGNTAAYGSLENAERMIAQSLSVYPNIKYVIDVRRGVYYDEEGNLLSPSYTEGGKDTAQMRFSVGSGSSEFETELGAANTLFSALQKREAYSVMPTRIKNGSLVFGSGVPVITLEIGSAVTPCGEALLAAEMFAKTFAELTKW